MSILYTPIDESSTGLMSKVGSEKVMKSGREVTVIRMGSPSASEEEGKEYCLVFPTYIMIFLGCEESFGAVLGTGSGLTVISMLNEIEDGTLEGLCILKVTFQRPIAEVSSAYTMNLLFVSR